MWMSHNFLELKNFKINFINSTYPPAYIYSCILSPSYPVYKWEVWESVLYFFFLPSVYHCDLSSHPIRHKALVILLVSLSVVYFIS